MVRHNRESGFYSWNPYTNRTVHGDCGGFHYSVQKQGGLWTLTIDDKRGGTSEFHERHWFKSKRKAVRKLNRKIHYWYFGRLPEGLENKGV